MQHPWYEEEKIMKWDGGTQNSLNHSWHCSAFAPRHIAVQYLMLIKVTCMVMNDGFDNYMVVFAGVRNGGNYWWQCILMRNAEWVLWSGSAGKHVRGVEHCSTNPIVLENQLHKNSKGNGRCGFSKYFKMGRLVVKLKYVQLCECLLIPLLRKPTLFAESVRAKTAAL